MRCFSPVTLKSFDKMTGSRQVVPCGKCMACLVNKRQQWVYRLKQEAKDHIHLQFLTLTYNDEHLPVIDELSGQATLVKSDVQNFFKRLRKSIEPLKIRYYLVGEYGFKTKRPHYHVLLFGLPVTREYNQKLVSAWSDKEGNPIGAIHQGKVTGSSICYTATYHIMRAYTEVDGVVPTFTLMSRKPGIGYSYIDKRMQWHLKDRDRFYCQDLDGPKVSLPRYYSEKIYSDMDRMIHRKRVLEMLGKLPCENSRLFIERREDYRDRILKVLQSKGKL